MAQNVVVVLIVGCCFIYAVWTMAPKAPRSRLAMALLKLPLPLLLRKSLAAAARQQSGCGCDGCDRSTSAGAKQGKASAGQQAQGEFKPITFVRGNFPRKAPR